MFRNILVQVFIIAWAAASCSSKCCCSTECSSSTIDSRWTMPLVKIGEKQYYFGVFFKANWYNAMKYCRFHGMHLVSISSQEENEHLERHVNDLRLGHHEFWTSGTDLADKGNFYWMGNGRQVTYTNWNSGEPNNEGEEGNAGKCVENRIENRDGKGWRWNDRSCDFEAYFVCEV